MERQINLCKEWNEGKRMCGTVGGSCVVQHEQRTGCGKGGACGVGRR